MTPATANPPRKWSEALASLIGPQGLLIALIFTFNLFLDQVMTELIQDELMSEMGASAWIWVYGGFTFAAGLLGPLLVSFLALSAWRHQGTSLLQVARQHLGYLVKEEMRVLGKTLLWSLLLIIPGIIRFFQLLFVPYVVLLDGTYQQGEADALKRSWVFVRRVWGRLLGLVLFFGLVWPVAFTSLDEWRSLRDQPLTAFPLVLVDLTVILTFHWLILKSWEKAHEPDVQMV